MGISKSQYTNHKQYQNYNTNIYKILLNVLLKPKKAPIIGAFFTLPS